MARDGQEYTNRQPAPRASQPFDPYGGDLPPGAFRQPLFFDRQFGRTSMVVLLLFPIVAGAVALIFSLAGVFLCEEPRARRNAFIVLAISLISTAAFAALFVIGKR
jgi:hypothetical protein